MPSSSDEFNPVQNRENIRVAVRVRPLLETEHEYEEMVSVLGDQTIILKKGSTRSQLNFDRTFAKETTQEEVYETVKLNIESVLKGFNATVFAYGQTGTGKTYTMLGIDFTQDTKIPLESWSNPTTEFKHVMEKKGIIPRSVQHILEHIKRSSHETRYKIYCSYLEIYNEKIYDLLSFENDKQQHLEIREDKTRGLYVQDLTAVLVTKEADIYELMQQGAKNRSIAQTDMNERSSRSHTIFQLFIEQEPINPRTDEEKVMKMSKLNLVDLAGSEKWNTFSRFKMQDKRIQELTSINQSLSTLGNCISALMQPGRVHIPYRNSKLTRLLQDSLGGNTKTLFVATISPSVLAFDETMSTLKFADRAMRVVVTTTVNEVVDDSALLKRYEKEISRLRKLLKHTSSYESQIKQLQEENQKLRDDSQNVNVYKNMDDSEKLGSKVLQSQEVAMKRKLDVLEQIERDQRERENELDRYHNWLYSVPVAKNGQEASVEMKDRLNLMEKSIMMQVKELERTKKLFLRDLKILKAELAERTEDLQVSQAKIKAQQKEIASLNEQIEDANIIMQKLSEQNGIPSRYVGKEVQVTDNASMGEYETTKTRTTSKFSIVLQAFKSNLTTIVQEHISEFISPQFKTNINNELQQLVEGCTEALEENISKAYEDFCSNTQKLLKQNSTRIKVIEQPKSRGVVESKSIQTEYEENVELLDQIKRIISQSVGDLPSDPQKNYWKTIVTNVSDVRNFQSQLYVNTVSIRNTLSRVLEITKDFENISGVKDFEYHRKYLQNVLESASQTIEDFETKTFIKPSQKRFMTFSPFKNFKPFEYNMEDINVTEDKFMNLPETPVRGGKQSSLVESLIEAEQKKMMLESSAAAPVAATEPQRQRANSTSLLQPMSTITAPSQILPTNLIEKPKPELKIEIPQNDEVKRDENIDFLIRDLIDKNLSSPSPVDLNASIDSGFSTPKRESRNSMLNGIGEMRKIIGIDELINSGFPDLS